MYVLFDTINNSCICIIYGLVRFTATHARLMCMTQELGLFVKFLSLKYVFLKLSHSFRFSGISKTKRISENKKKTEKGKTRKYVNKEK